MIDDFDDHIRELPFSFYFDNLFTGIPALLQLKSLGCNATGTIRENRLPNSCPLKQKKKITKKLGRGYMAGKSVHGSHLHLTNWVDNSVVSVASTVYGMNPITKALRYSAEQKAKVEVPRPFVVAKYNQFMGGVDRMDQNISLYRIGIHGKKWWSSIFTWSARYDNLNHWPRCIPSRRRCAEVNCEACPKTICSKCNVGLCIKCFESYHSLEKFKQ